jgi:ATP-dependent Lon protease
MKKIKIDDKKLPKVLPIIPVQDAVIFPKMILTIEMSSLDGDSDTLFDFKNKVVGIIMRKSEKKDDLHKIGTLVFIHDVLEIPGSDYIKVSMQGLKRFRLKSMNRKKNYLEGNVSVIREKNVRSKQSKNLVPTVIDLFDRATKLSKHIPREYTDIIREVKSPSQIADMVASTLSLSVEKKQEFLVMSDVKDRLNELVKLLNQQIAINRLGNKISSQARSNMEESQRKYFLREQMAAIKKELGEEDEEDYDEVEEYKQKAEAAHLPEEAQKEAQKEIKRLKRVHPSSAERSVITTYLDCLTELPWDKSTKDDIDVNKAKEILDSDHFGLKKPKKRVLEYLAVKKLKADSQGPILCFVGPPGTGKTSLGRSIARALGREFIRISLGGVRDEAEIRGHRRTYVGALPGRIIQGIKRAGTNNPIFMLDEIDKLGNDFRGDPSSALLEVLDPEQNYSFSDHYLDVPFDLSKVMFITTANVLETIPPALKDRMEVIRFSGYTQPDKINIANQFLIPKQREAHGLKFNQIKFNKRALDKIIESYTFEAGVRNLEREIANACRGVATEIVSNKIKSRSITVKNVRDYLGREKIPPVNEMRKLLPGMSSALFVSGNGGFIGYIEAILFKKGMSDEEIILTGQLGEVMQESAIIALDYIRTISDIVDIPEVEDKVIHIHAPEGATPKDGPSAGVALFCALVSLFNDKPIKKNLAMTGEITLKGEVLPVGGIKEKVIGAHRAGMKEIILPKWNKNDLDGVPKEILKEVKFHFVKHALEVLEIAF